VVGGGHGGHVALVGAYTCLGGSTEIKSRYINSYESHMESGRGKMVQKRVEDEMSFFVLLVV